MRLLILPALFVAILMGIWGYRLLRFYARVRGW